MYPQDLKRLIAGFLAFSVITSIVTLVSLNFTGTANPQQEALQVEGDNPLSTVTKNAFVEKLPSSGQQSFGLADGQSAYSGDSSASSNLTENFAKKFAAQIIDRNPNGPQLDTNGSPALINVPSEENATDIIIQALATTNIGISTDIKDSDLKVKDSYSSGDVAAYLSAISDILSSVISSSNSPGINSGDFTSDTLSLGQLIFDTAEQKLKAVTVPRKFLGMHKALVSFFANQNNVSQIAANYQNDPLKSVIVLKSDDKVIDRDLAKITEEFNKVKPELLSYDNGVGENISLVENIFGIRTARATGLPVVDSLLGWITGLSWSKEFASKALDWAEKIALQVLKNQLIAELQNQIVNWISGNGNPKFITDWNGFLKDVANKAAGEALYSITSQACTGFGPLLKIALLPVPRASSPFHCTLTQVVNNVNSFFNRFKTGTWYQTWTAYGALMQPSNNFFGQLIIGHDEMITKASDAETAANNQAVANKGFLSVTKCTKYALDEDNNPTTTCEPGHEVVTTPGVVAGETLTKSIGWPADTVINANDITGLVAAIVNASINRIIKEGLSALTPSTNPPAPSYSGTSHSISTNMNYAMSSLEQTGVFQQNQNIIAADTQWLALEAKATSTLNVSSTMDLLNQIVSSCSGSAPVARQRISELNALASTTIAELNTANNLNAIKTSAATATSSQDIANIIKQIQGVDLDQITATATAAQNRLASLKYFTTLVQASIADNDCGATLPSPTVTPPPLN